MPRDIPPPRFKLWSAPKKAPIATDQINAGRYRISPRRRGYDAAWDKLSRAFRRRNPWCFFCMQERPEESWEMTAVADHVLPAHEFPHLRRVWKNLIPLCEHHHDTTKQKLEHYARQHGCLELLVDWCFKPMTRPPHLRPTSINEVLPITVN